MGRKKSLFDFHAVRRAVGDRVRAARIAAGLTQLEIAHAIGYTASNPVSKLENGDVVHVDIARLAAVARACDVDLDVLVEPATRAVQGRFRAPRSSR